MQVKMRGQYHAQNWGLFRWNIHLKLNEELRVTKLPSNIEQLKQRIEHSEDKINQLVYELYELSPEEIKIVEGGSND